MTQEILVFKSTINRLLLAVVLLNTCALIGCHRSYYRRQADTEARRLIREKAVDPRWDSADGTIEVDPQSRMFNPFSQDHPPIPPDDAVSHQFMHRVNGKEGYPHWHANGDTDFVESPEWRSYLPTNEKGQVVLNLERAYQLALIHSPTLQQQRETLYSSAIDVSLQRFGFDSQMFTGFNSFLTTQGRLRNGSSSTTLQSQIGANGGGLNIRKLGITGSNFAVGLANTILFNFAGNNTQSATSLIDFSLIQPLLRGAGRDRIMESLTQSERTLLANIRQLERFRRGFYLQVAIGRNPGAGPNGSGNFLGTPGSASSNAGGYFGLLEQQQQIRNQKLNVRQLEGVLEQFREFFRRERLDAVSLKLFETNVYQQQRRLLDSETSYQTSLDNFKLSLGLPPDLEVVIDDTLLDRFELISDQINDRLIAVGKLREQTGNALNSVTLLYDKINEEDFKWPTTVSKEIATLVPFLDEAAKTLESVTNEDRKQLEADFSKLEAKREGRLEYLKNLQAEIESGKIISEIDADLVQAKSVVEAEKLRQRLEDKEVDSKEFIMVDGKEEIPQYSILKRASVLRTSLKRIRENIDSFEEAENKIMQIDRLLVLDANEDGKLTREEMRDRTQTEFNLGDQDLNGFIEGQEIEDLLSLDLLTFISTEFFEKIPGQLTEMNNLILEISLLQALARANSIEVTDINIDSRQAIEIARCMRRDWMNARASLVDNYRNIEFVADQLEAQVDIVFEGDIGNNGDNPFKLRYETGQLRAGFRFDAPIVRMSERNQYRQALISYQQTRRQFYQFEDNVARNIRQILRTVDQNKVLFELDRRTVETQIENVEINRYELDRPAAIGATGSQLGANTARNLTDAINNLNGAQNSFLSSWVQLEVLRRNLDFDMGTMQLDQMGEWIDPGVIDASIGVRTASKLGIELDCQFCKEVGVTYETDSSFSETYNQGQPTDAMQLDSSGEFPQKVPLEEGSVEPILDSTPRNVSPESLQLRGPRTSGLLRSRALSQSAMLKSNSTNASGSVAQRSSQKPTGSKVSHAIAGSLKSIDSFKSVASVEDRKPKVVASIEKPAFAKPIERIVSKSENKPTLSKSEFDSAIIQFVEKANRQTVETEPARQSEPTTTPQELKRVWPFAIAKDYSNAFALPTSNESASRISNEFIETRTELVSRLVEESSPNVESPTKNLSPVAVPTREDTHTNVTLSPIEPIQTTKLKPTLVPQPKLPRSSNVTGPTSVVTKQPTRKTLHPSEGTSVKILKATTTQFTTSSMALEKEEAKLSIVDTGVNEPLENAAVSWEPPKTPVAVDSSDDSSQTVKTNPLFGHTLNSQKDAFNWKTKPSSLSSVLERFRTEKDE